MSTLPSFDDMRRDAFKLLGDAEDVLRSDWREGTGPTRAQADAAADAKVLIGQAKDALDRAGRLSGN